METSTSACFERSNSDEPTSSAGFNTSRKPCFVRMIAGFSKNGRMGCCATTNVLFYNITFLGDESWTIDHKAICTTPRTPSSKIYPSKPASLKLTHVILVLSTDNECRRSDECSST
ncbi:hypothetical protein Ae201684P_019650 [Aphanomyces euteiches]|uniref:Uncharacterized protein n=1 Tax=Aphanomyces euteiches TaxID=100861 RepID=A0A6G0XDS3_9STRA|nr:hypothetical protein Ae201684_005816 [Aphanomyces euteiches]KAH9078568.1 hypothetical protein Ae201684P_019650 [Aphanomyces euteiches]